MKSREKIASDAPRTIQNAYGDMTSLFTSSEDGDGVFSLVDLLLGKLDSMHDRFISEKCYSSSNDPSSSSSSMTRLEQILEQHNVFQVLEKLDSAVNQVIREEREFNEAEASDKTSAREAIKLAKCTRTSPSSRKKRRVLPAESIGYHAHKLKLGYQQSLSKELKEIENENEVLEQELANAWAEWESSVEGVKTALATMDTGASKRG